MASKGIKGLVLGIFFVLLLGLVVGSILKNNAQTQKVNTVTADSSTVDSSESFNKMKSMAEALETRLKDAPQDVDLLLSLANTYYDLGVEAGNVAPDKETEYFSKAVSHYRQVIKTRDDVSILVDMATAAFYGQDNQTADEMFQKAVKKDPYFYQAHFNYGVFLLHAKEDLEGSLREWKAALAANPNSPDVERLKQLIAGVEEQLKAQNPAPKS